MKKVVFNPSTSLRAGFLLFTFNLISRAWRGLRNLTDPAMEGSPYQTLSYRFEKTSKPSWSYFGRRYGIREQSI